MKILHEIAAGGQTWAHRMRMLRQVLRIAILFSLFGGTLLTVSKIAKKEPKENYQAVWYLSKAYVLGFFQEKITVNSHFWRKLGGVTYNQKVVQVDKRLVLKKCKRLTLLFFHSLSQSFKTKQTYHSFIYIFILCNLYFLWRGHKAKNRKHLSGIKTLSDVKLSATLKMSFKASDLRMGGVPLLKKSETSHMLICGATRSGKTNALYQLLKQVRKRGDKVVIIDSTNIFTSAFYDERKDVLFNPYDSRFPGWHPWVECNEEYHFRELVNSLIPDTKFDDYFPEAAREVLYSALRKRAAQGDFSIESLTDLLLKAPMNDLYEELKDTSAHVYTDPKGERMTASVRGTLNKSFSYFSLIRDSQDPFSIRKWVLEKDIEPNWLFLSSQTGQRDNLRNLIGMWFSIATNALMSKNPLSESRDRVWFVVDELHSLKKLEYLPASLAELGKYGGCIVLATQNVSQLEEIYGPRTAESIADQCGTKVCFRQQSAKLAEKMSSLFGQQEVQEVQEGLSYGAHQMRDGVSLSKHERTRSTVSPTKILSLDNLEAYIKLPGSIPATKTKFKYEKIISRADGFVNMQRKKEEPSLIKK